MNEELARLSAQAKDLIQYLTDIDEITAGLELTVKDLKHSTSTSILALAGALSLLAISVVLTNVRISKIK